MDSLVSVIVPVYNVEKYVEKSLSSIQNQTYRNLEILIVDDGSTDQSADFCNLYTARDNRITFISIRNAGQASARNICLDIMQGKYVVFVDSDDMLHPKAIEEFVRVLDG